MKKIMIKFKRIFNKRKFKYGGYAAGMTAAVVIVVLLINLLVTTLDTNFDISFDLTANRVYSLTAQTEHVLDALEQDVYIYTLFSQGQEDPTINELVERYKGKSKNIHLSNIDMVKNPRIVSYYENKKGIMLSQGGLIVSTSDDPTNPEQSFKILDVYDLFGYDTTTEDFTLFTGESAVTGAIRYVLDPNIPKVWFLEGHGTTNANWIEMRNMLEDENYDTAGLSLLSTPDDLQKGDIIIVAGPSIDLSSDEREILLDFALDGGKIMIMFDPSVSDQLPNFKKILSHYNVELLDGIAIEDQSNTDAYYIQPSFIVPEYTNNEITASLKTKSIPILMLYSGAFEIGATQSGISVLSLMESSEQSFLEPLSDDYDVIKNDDAIMGPFSVAAAITREATNDTEKAQLIIVASKEAFNDMGNMPTTGNYEFFLNAVSWLNPNEEEFYIRGKSLKTSVLYFKSSAQILTIVILVTVVIPLLAFAIGIFMFLRRRHL
ncbi:MAG: GldG family protein [Clostridiales bacterium]|nr:GldG family protein [Clostridiales bacterium]